MATIDSTYDKNNLIEDSIQPQWDLLAASDVGAKVLAGNYNDKTFHVFDVGAAASITLRGSNKRGADVNTPADWFTLKDISGDNITLTAIGGGTIAGNPIWISPILTAGVTTSIGVLGKK